MSPLDFAALMCSRLCHDLVGPVGAISNGLEILSEESSSDMEEQVKELLANSTEQAKHKLQFFRLAFGASSNVSMELDYTEARNVLENFFKGSRLRFVWEAGPGVGSKKLIKLVLNMALVVSETLIRGGDLKVDITGEGEDLTVNICGVGNRVIVQDIIFKTLTEEDFEEEESRAVPALLIKYLARELEGRVSITDNDSGIFALEFKKSGA